MTGIADFSPTDALNIAISGESLEGNVANMGRMEETLQAIIGAIGRWTSSDTIASASTTDIGAQEEAYLTVSGTTTITAFGTVRTGTMRFLRFSGALTLTHNATSLILPGAANITTAAGDTAVFVSEGSGNWRCLAYQRGNGMALVAAATAPPKGHIFGLALSKNASDATNDIDIEAGEASSDDATAVLLTLASALTKRLDAAWAVGTGNGGLDTGAIANSTYYLWLIQRSDTSVVDALASLSATAPTMPTSYDRKRLIGFVTRTAGVNGIPVMYAQPLIQMAGVAPVFGCRAWVNFNGTTGAIRASGNVSSITVNATGDYTINFANALVDANYAVTVTGSRKAAVESDTIGTVEWGTPPTVSAVRVSFRDIGGTAVNSTYCNVTVFR